MQQILKNACISVLQLFQVVTFPVSNGREKECPSLHLHSYHARFTDPESPDPQDLQITNIQILDLQIADPQIL